MRARTEAAAGQAPAPTRYRSAPHEVRIIGGQWRRTKLPVRDLPGLRPTPDRVRETVFNWLGQDLSGRRCIDAFAGTGALGFEAASRGAAEVLLVERDAALAARLSVTKDKLHADGVRVQRGDGALVLGQSGAWDVLFLDPPFEAPALLQSALQAAAHALRPGGCVYLEAPKKWGEELLATDGWVLHRYLRAGAVHAHLLVRASVA